MICLPRDPERARPSDDHAALQAMLAAERVENERLCKIIRELQRHRFGPRPESLPPDQLQLGLEEVDSDDEATADAAGPAVGATRVAKRRANRGSLPAHLPRVETVVDIADDSCSCCPAPLHYIGEDVSERLDVVDGAVPGAGGAPTEMRLSRLHGRRGPGAQAGG